MQNCADTGGSYWVWTTEDWAELCGSSAEAFVAARELPTETTVRPFLLALAYLLGGFVAFQLLGTFNRLHLARLVFGDCYLDINCQVPLLSRHINVPSVRN